jgi:anti-sigma regulatory factor (Ser/Thr protein kinase)
MCRTTSTAACELPAAPEAASLVRSWVRESLCAEHASAAEAAAMLLASEAVTLAVLHGSPPLTVSMECRVTRVVISVADSARGDLVPVDLDDHLRVTLISKVAREWGVHLTQEGKVVWCTLPTGSVPGQVGAGFEPGDPTPGDRASGGGLPAGSGLD